MSNLMSNIYIGLVVEIIKENGKPTLDIRVRIPSLHIGLKDEDLPIAKPIIMPGMFVDPIHFENYFSQVNRVYVIFDSGSKAMPRYFGALGEGASTIIPEESTAGLLPFINLTVDTLPDIAQKETLEAVLFKTNVIYLVRFKNGTMVSEPTLNGINIQLGVTNVSDSMFSAASEAIIPMFYDSTTNTLKLTGSYSTGLADLADIAYSGDYGDLINKPDIADMATQTWVANQHYAIEGASYTKEETDVSLAAKVDKENVVDTFGTISSELIPSTKAVSERYVLSIDESIPDLNNYTLREVFENRNMAMSDLMGKPEISPNTYRLFQIDVITLDYNIINGNYISNSTGGQSFASLSFNVEIGKQYTLKSIYVSGTTNSTFRVLINGTYQNIDIMTNNSITFTPTTSANIIVGHSSGTINDNFTFKLQLEQGDTATPYQVPTNGPYNDIDIATLDLSVEQMDFYYNLYKALTQAINKVDKVSTASRVYGTDSSSTQTTFGISQTTNDLSIAQRYTDGRLRVGNAVDNNDAVTKLQMDDSIEASEESIIKRVVETKTVQGLIEPNLPNGQDLLLNVKRSVLSNWEVEAQAESDFVIPGTRYGEVKVGDRLYFTTGLEGLTNLGAQGYQTFKINYYDIVTKKFGVLYEDNNLYMAFFNNGFTYDPINEDFYILCGDVYDYNAKEVLGFQKLSEFIKPFKINKNTLIKTEVANVYNNDNEALRTPNGAVYYNGKIYVSYGEKFTITGKTWANADEVAFDNSKNAIEEIVLSPVTNITQMQTLFPVDTYEVGTVIATVYEGTKTYYRVGLIASGGKKDSTLKVYDIETNTWSLGATPPEPIGTQHQQGTSIIVDNKIYVKRSLLFNVYDITTNTWSSLQSPLVGDVHNESPAYHNGYIYYGGGYVGSGSVTPVVPEARNSDIVQRYNIATNQWELHSRLPNLVNELQGYGSLIVKDNFMYYLLGYVYNHEDNNITYVNKTVYKYDLSKGTSYYQYDENLLKENVDGLYVSKTELTGITDEQINNIDYVPIQNQDIQQKQKMRLYIVNNQIGYDMEEE